MNDRQRAAMTMALEALEKHGYDWYEYKYKDVEKAQTALREALAQPQDCKECGAKQAKIDSLMLEYCHDEITDEQMAEWAKYQTPVQECRHCGWLCKPNHSPSRKGYVLSQPQDKGEDMAVLEGLMILDRHTQKQPRCKTCGDRGFHDYGHGDYRDCKDCVKNEQPQGEWVDLTDDEIDVEFKDAGFPEYFGCAVIEHKAARAIIAKFKEKNTPPVVWDSILDKPYLCHAKMTEKEVVFADGWNALRNRLLEHKPTDWMQRALEAEALNERLIAEFNAENGPTFMGEPVIRTTPPVVPQGEPAAIPEWPEIETLADIDYAQCQKPESWDEGHFKAWQDLQVAQRNKIILHKYAKVLRELLQTTKPVVSQGEPVAWAYWPDCFDEKLDKGLLCNYEPTAYEKRRPLTYADTTPPSVEVAVDADSTNSCQKSNELVEPPKLHRAGSFGHD